MCELITNNKETELVWKKGVGNNYQLITDNVEIELEYKPYRATFGKEIGGKEERGKTTWEKLQHLTRAKNNGKGKKEKKKAIKLEAGFTTMTKVF